MSGDRWTDDAALAGIFSFLFLVLVVMIVVFIYLFSEETVMRSRVIFPTLSVPIILMLVYVVFIYPHTLCPCSNLAIDYNTPPIIKHQT